MRYSSGCPDSGLIIGFGGPHTSGSSDIGTAIVYAVVFSGLLALSYYAGPARYSADYYLEKRISWWWQLDAAAQARIPEATAPQPSVPADDVPAGQPHAV